MQGSGGGTLPDAGDEKGRGWGSGAREMEENACAFGTGPVAHLSARSGEVERRRFGRGGTTKVRRNVFWRQSKEPV